MFLLYFTVVFRSGPRDHERPPDPGAVPPRTRWKHNKGPFTDKLFRKNSSRKQQGLISLNRETSRKQQGLISFKRETSRKQQDLISLKRGTGRKKQNLIFLLEPGRKKQILTKCIHLRRRRRRNAEKDAFP